MCLIRYNSKIFDIFPSMLTNHLLVVEKQKWMDELKVNVDIRKSLMVNEEQSNICLQEPLRKLLRFNYSLTLLRDSSKICES